MTSVLEAVDTCLAQPTCTQVCREPWTLEAQSPAHCCRPDDPTGAPGSVPSLGRKNGAPPSLNLFLPRCGGPRRQTSPQEQVSCSQRHAAQDRPSPPGLLFPSFTDTEEGASTSPQPGRRLFLSELNLSCSLYHSGSPRGRLSGLPDSWAGHLGLPVSGPS